MTHYLVMIRIGSALFCVTWGSYERRVLRKMAFSEYATKPVLGRRNEEQIEEDRSSKGMANDVSCWGTDLIAILED